MNLEVTLKLVKRNPPDTESTDIKDIQNLLASIEELGYSLYSIKTGHSISFEVR